jgi:cell division protein ZapA (FtsZ GTPase activity inhibitor)
MAAHTVLRFYLDGREYTLHGDMSQEQMQDIVDAVEEKINKIREIAPHYSSVRVATLAALQLAELLLESRDENAALMQEAAH